jgi:hypothetical protein
VVQPFWLLVVLELPTLSLRFQDPTLLDLLENSSEEVASGEKHWIVVENPCHNSKQ